MDLRACSVAGECRIEESWRGRVRPIGGPNYKLGAVDERCTGASVGRAGERGFELPLFQKK